ncbi:MAG: hypothetical protein OXF41_02910 [bacterium]|nr:hypothetical protein [bacterium]
MSTATEGYADAKASEALAKAEAGIEKAINRLVRWIVGTAIALGSFLVAIDRL